MGLDGVQTLKRSSHIHMIHLQHRQMIFMMCLDPLRGIILLFQRREACKLII